MLAAALASGDSAKTVQEALGHHSAVFTLDTYGHISERMEQFINSVKNL